jgi:formylglycine-generating enzyme required for sulfatase activity
VAKIFISYRREDSQHQADRLHAALSKRIPKRNIFIDVDNIPVGVDFVQHLEQQVGQCDVLLALIGPDWLEAKNPQTGKRRLDDPKDFVRIEIAAALKRGIPVAPVLLDGAPFPSENQLPEDLKALTRRNGVEVRRLTFDADAERLVRGLELTHAATAAKPASARPAPAAGSAGSASWIGPAVALGVLVLGGGAFAWFGNPGDWRGIEAAPSDPVLPAANESAGYNAASSVAKPGAGSTQAAGVCGDVNAIVYFDFDKAVLTTDASAVLEGAVRKTFDCVVDRVSIEAHEDLGGTTAYAQKLSARRANAVAAALQSSGIEPGKITTTGFGDTRPLNTGIASPLNRRVEVTLALSSPQVTVPEPAEAASSSTPSSMTRATANSRAGETFRDCSDCPQMVSIPAGSFMMGSPASETGRFDNEGPQRRVSVPAFAAGKLEVTWNEYDACVSAGACASLASDGFGGGTRPVTNVSWNEAAAYTKWLSNKTGQTYRLLSEAEWEYAARAGTSSAYWWGGSASHEYANYGKDTFHEGLASGADRWIKTSPAGSFPANGFGLFDMHGNVLEWVKDCGADNYSAGQPSNGSAYTSGSCSSRVSRGGSWYSYPQDLRSAFRVGYVPAGRGDFLGFRVAKTP